ncbi:hypothetical protein [Alkalicoccobacillus gibsonii]|jgi:chromosome segregation ATPase|uniref:hypothetical protein n=1 Tax=Alkalicoccobacillus gibsonii TaxID=79881 RepID=UPI0019327048|nr:hypothetical protein [Alkalicoccobacillus gibsonii]MBM0065085.1 hypothetical protein [Alkalicoccobacillus gibsonii]
MSTIEQELTKMKQAIDQARDMRYRAEAKLEELQNQRDRILKELEELGVGPDELENEIKKLESEVEQAMSETWSLIPKELIKHDA